ncbi:alpha/beta-hydrolase [Exidia glandulosa HHB12029]|uniref:Alpha/beta-hydrolase n=1 Tax=Exidia glandulosa HHB12029 TaxID=1314781 RepID=A0A165DJ22_EXIGL|nr:alpha/beta-hydrolase [Exidia glandulosa HHB12029]
MLHVWLGILVSLAAPARSTVPSVGELGSLTIVHPNDLDTNSTVESLLLLHQPRTYEAAGRACATAYEKQATRSDISPAIRQHLAFLVADGQLRSTDGLWVTQSDSTSEHPACMAYSLSAGTFEEEACDTPLLVLCTQSAPATTVSTGDDVAPSSQVAVKAGSSQFVGYRDARSFRFLGIKYGEAPLGARRFLSTISYMARGLFDATRFKSVCLQNEADDFAAKGEHQSEDCLHLNIFTPFLPSSSSHAKLKAVGFWIHGGGFTVGSGSRPVYDGGNFASRGDVLIVTLNYRLDILGLLADMDGADNAWLSDIILALHWVQENIAAFGGDPNKVTIFGESSGALAISALLSSPAASGLFHAAISESSLLATPWLLPRVYTELLTPAIAAAFMADNSTVDAPVAFMRSIPAERFSSSTAAEAAATQLAAIQDKLFHTSGVDIRPLLPTIGGLIPDQFVYLVRNGSVANKVPLMLGTNRDEVALVIYGLPGFEAPVPPDVGIYNTLLAEFMGQDAASAIIVDGTYALNTSDVDGVRRGLSTASTARGFTCAMRQLLAAGLHSNAFNTSELFVFRFEAGYPLVQNEPSACFPEGAGPSHPVCHASEILPVFGNFNVLGVPLNTTEELHFTQYANDIWPCFIRTHTPDVSVEYLEARGQAYAATLASVRAAPFRAFDRSTAGTHVIASEPRNEGPFDSQECAVFDNLGYAFDHIDNGF